eukprot:GAHX01001910.1.p1 GENE.GAHX01001910.1~~GAHX01001910.1.p1  ORF type:complete len:596 (+),score=139.08 GAHX01001910.1:208-1995(+)
MKTPTQLPYKWAVYLVDHPNITDLYASEKFTKLGRYRNVEEFVLFWNFLKQKFNGAPYNCLTEANKLMVVHHTMDLTKHTVTSRGSELILKFTELELQTFLNLLALVTAGTLDSECCSFFGISMQLNDTTYTIKLLLNTQAKEFLEMSEKKIIDKLDLTISKLTFVAPTRNILRRRSSFLVDNKHVAKINTYLFDKAFDENNDLNKYKNPRIFYNVDWKKINKRVKEKPAPRMKFVEPTEVEKEESQEKVYEDASIRLRERDDSWVNKNCIKILGIRKSIDFTVQENKQLDFKDLVLKETNEPQEKMKKEEAKPTQNEESEETKLAMKRAVKESLLLYKYFENLDKEVFSYNELRYLNDEQKGTLNKQKCIFCFKDYQGHEQCLINEDNENTSGQQRSAKRNQVNFYFLNCVKEPKCHHILPFECLAQADDFSGFKEHIRKRFSGEVTEAVSSAKYKRNCNIIRRSEHSFRVDTFHILTGELFESIELKKDVFHKVELMNNKEVYILEGTERPYTLTNGIMKIFIKIPYLNKNLEIIYDLSKYLLSHDNIKLYFKYPLINEIDYNFVKLEVFINRRNENSFFVNFFRISFTKSKR